MGVKEQVIKLLDTVAFDLDDNQTVSDALDCGGLTLAGLVFPADLDATSITFQVSADGVTYQQLYYEGAAYSEVVAASISLSLEHPTAFWPWRYVKIVAGTTQTTGEGITITAILRSVAP